MRKNPSVQGLVGDYVRAKTSGGNEFEGDITKVWENGIYAIIPDGMTNSVAVAPDGILEILNPGRIRQRMEAKKNPITADEALSFVKVLSRESGTKRNVPEGFGARLKELIRQGLTPKDAMSQAWREIKLSRTRSKGKKFNPTKNPILVYNPPKGGKLLYSKVISIVGYHRSKARIGTWRHAFSNGVQAIGLKDGNVLLRSTSGKRLWALDSDL